MKQSTAKDEEGVVSREAEDFSGLVLGVAFNWQRLVESAWDS